jgi:hypothetical protein
MPTTYQYTRDPVGDHYDIDNENLPPGPAFGTRIAEDIKAALPGKHFDLKLDGTTMDVTFLIALSPEDEAILDATVAAHKSA